MDFNPEDVATFMAVVGLMSVVAQTFVLNLMLQYMGIKNSIIVGLLLEMLQLFMLGFSSKSWLLIVIRVFVDEFVMKLELILLVRSRMILMQFRLVMHAFLRWSRLVMAHFLFHLITVVSIIYYLHCDGDKILASYCFASYHKVFKFISFTKHVVTNNAFKCASSVLYRIIWSAGLLGALSTITYPAISAFASAHASEDQQG